MSASRPASVTEICSLLGRSATRTRIGSGSVSWRRRLYAFFAADAEIGADGGDAVLLAQAGTGSPKVAELVLLIAHRK
jgi:hypothetical protein